MAAGHTLSSATDTEVMAHLIEAEHGRPARRLAEATRAMLRRVRGAFSIAVVSADEPDTIVAARRSTPLVLGLHDGMALLASDIPALIGHTPTRSSRWPTTSWPSSRPARWRSPRSTARPSSPSS